MGDVAERLREMCRDWDGSEMLDAAETRTTVDCRTMREAAEEIEALRAKLAVGEQFLNSCYSAWSCGEPYHRVKVMTDRADEFRAALTDTKGDRPLSLEGKE